MLAMPPIPITLDQETLALISSANRRANDISEFQVKRLHDCEGPLSLQQNLASELREDLDTLARMVEVGFVLVLYRHLDFLKERLV
jgi:protein transport protein SEC20